MVVSVNRASFVRLDSGFMSLWVARPPQPPGWLLFGTSFRHLRCGFLFGYGFMHLCLNGEGFHLLGFGVRFFMSVGVLRAASAPTAADLSHYHWTQERLGSALCAPFSQTVKDPNCIALHRIVSYIILTVIVYSYIFSHISIVYILTRIVSIYIHNLWGCSWPFGDSKCVRAGILSPAPPPHLVGCPPPMF